MRVWRNWQTHQTQDLAPLAWGFDSLHLHQLRKWLNGRAPPCQGGCCGFESRLSLQKKFKKVLTSIKKYIIIILYLRVSYIGNTPAFQAGKVGSIPTTRSMLKLCFTQLFFMYKTTLKHKKKSSRIRYLITYYLYITILH